jgi:outer membrane biosynthesis protein TonB
MPGGHMPEPDANQDILAGWLATQEAADQENGGSMGAMRQGGAGQQLGMYAGRRLAQMPMQQPASPALEQPASPVLEQPASPALEQPASPAQEQPASPAPTPTPTPAPAPPAEAHWYWTAGPSVVYSSSTWGNSNVNWGAYGDR